MHQAVSHRVLRAHPPGASPANRIAALVAALLAAACRDSTEPVVAGSMELSTRVIAFDAIGATETITATVEDPLGRELRGASLEWSSLTPNVTVKPIGPLTATVTAVADGEGRIFVSTRGARATASVQVTQRATALEKAGGDRQTGTVGALLPSDLRVRVLDRLGAPVAGRLVEFSVFGGGGSLRSDKVISGADGSAATSWTLGTDASAWQTVGAVVAGVGMRAEFTVTALAGSPSSISAVAGDGQTAVVNSAVAIAPAVVVRDAFGNPIAGAAVVFATPPGAGAVTGAAQTTDAGGVATVGRWTLGTGAGRKTLTASVADLTPVIFSVTAEPAAPATILVVGGNGQQWVRGLALPVRPAVGVSDEFGNPIPAVGVTFEVVAGGGSIDGGAPTTNSAGMATLGGWTLGPAVGVNAVMARIDGAPLPGVTFTAEGLDPGSMVINAGNGQAAMAGGVLGTPAAVFVRNALGAPIVGRTVTFSVTGGGGEVTGAVAKTDGNGIARVGSWTLGPTAGPNSLTATVAAPGIIDTTVVFTAVGCGGGGEGDEGYAITLCVATPMSPSQRDAFETAAARWSAVITGDVPDVPVANIACGTSTPRLTATVDDVAIIARIEPIDGPGGILGAAGWCFRRAGGPGSGFPLIGVMRFDAADVAALEASGRFVAVILHEMGHVLGIGTLWSSFGFLQNPSAVGGPQNDTHFNGEDAITGFDEIGGLTYSGMKVPVENRFGSGTINAHWRESVLANELMTGFINSGENPLSALTVRSMRDLGYAIDETTADPFFLTLELRAAAATDPARIELIDDVFAGPGFTIDRLGRITRVR